MHPRPSAPPVTSAFAEEEPRAEPTGLDIDPRAKKRAPAAVRDAIVLGSLDDPTPEHPFDVVSLCFLVEHFSELLAPIRRAIDLLAPGDIPMISIPVLGSAKARQQGATWRLIDDPVSPVGHVRWFDDGSLRRLGAELGLQTERIARRGEVLYHLPHRAQRFLHGSLGTYDMPTGRRFIRNDQLRMLGAILLDGRTSPLLGRGDCLYGFFRKPAS